jgi:hypothetical protein
MNGESKANGEAYRPIHSITYSTLMRRTFRNRRRRRRWPATLISAPLDSKTAPATCRPGAEEAFSAPPSWAGVAQRRPLPATPWAGVALAKPPLPASEPRFHPSCAPTMKSNFLAIIIGNRRRGIRSADSVACWKGKGEGNSVKICTLTPFPNRHGNCFQIFRDPGPPGSLTNRCDYASNPRFRSRNTHYS